MGAELEFLSLSPEGRTAAAPSLRASLDFLIEQINRNFRTLRDVPAVRKAQVGLTIGNGVDVITAGPKDVYAVVPFNGTVTAWTLLADQAGSIVVDVWSDTYGNFPPTVADTIAGSEKPTLSGARKAQDESLTTWDTTVTAGDVIAFNVDSASTVTRVTLTLTVQPS